jgi:integrase/recombinase XerD
LSSSAATTNLKTPSPSPLLDRKIEEITSSLPAAFNKKVHSIGETNAAIIVDYITAMKTEINVTDNYRRVTIQTLCKLSRYFDFIRANLIDFLESYRKTETQDPLHKWIGTYNIFRTYLLRFFKWLYNPDIEPSKRFKPPVVENIAHLKRKEKSIYKPSDLWTQQDDLLFLKYCPGKREKCYHSISRDTSCRPSEILKLKIRDVVFKTTGNSQYAEACVNGKTGNRPIPLIDSIPYLKDYLEHEHPQAGNPNAPLISGIGKGLGRHMSAMRINIIYREYKTQIFPRLLESSNVLAEDKQKIKELLKKPWNPYIRRHSALTEKSTILKENVLRQHAGWSLGSQMHLKYLHYFGNESNESLLEAYGIIDKGIQLDQLRPKQCPNCSEPNKPDSKFCAKCRMILSYDAYNETLEKQKEEKNQWEQLRMELDQVKALLKQQP